MAEGNQQQSQTPHHHPKLIAVADRYAQIPKIGSMKLAMVLGMVNSIPTCT